MHTTRRTAERLGYVAGALFPVALWASFSLEEQGRTFPDFEDGAISASALREVFDISTTNRIGALLGSIAVVLLACFAIALHSRATRVAPAARTATTTGLVLIGVFSALVLSVGGPYLAASFYNVELVDPAVLLAWYAAVETLSGMFVGAFLAMAGFLATAAYLGFAHQIIPRWSAWLAAILAVTMAVGTLAAPFGEAGFIAWLSFMVFTAWAFVTALALAIRSADPAAPVTEVDSTIQLAA